MEKYFFKGNGEIIGLIETEKGIYIEKIEGNKYTSSIIKYNDFKAYKSSFEKYYLKISEDLFLAKLEEHWNKKKIIKNQNNLKKMNTNQKINAMEEAIEEAVKEIIKEEPFSVTNPANDYLTESTDNLLREMYENIVIKKPLDLLPEMYQVIINMQKAEKKMEEIKTAINIRIIKAQEFRRKEFNEKCTPTNTYWYFKGIEDELKRLKDLFFKDKS